MFPQEKLRLDGKIKADKSFFTFVLVSRDYCVFH